MEQDTEDQLARSAIAYHEYPRPGKISVTPTKSMVNQRDLALAYSPGVAVACNAIAQDPARAHKLTSRSNLVAVVSNGTAVLGLGNIGPLAAKPVMEGKGCLFKKFAGIDVFDIELNENDPDKLVDIIAALEPTFGGINLEDIKAPECFEIERKLRSRVKIPVFHDDQHGTAVVTAAAILNGLKVVDKKIGDCSIVVSGAGAAAIACLDLLVHLGLSKDKVTMLDSKGVVRLGRNDPMDESKRRYARETEARTLGDAMPGADIFLGLSIADVLKPEMVQQMAERPLILALANPDPEIRPDLAKQVRPDCVIATGRSDYPNQVNNVLCFPFIFRGALDVGATTINEEMELAAVHAIAELAEQEQSDVVAQAYGVHDRFGPEFLIPRPFDPRLITNVAPAVAAAAMKSGVATQPIADLRAYRDALGGFVYQSGAVMQPVFAAAANAPRRIVFAEGEDGRVLRAAQVLADEGLATPILMGRPDVIYSRIREIGLRMVEGRHYEIFERPEHAPDTAGQDWSELRQVQGGAELQDERRESTLIAAGMVRRGEADGLICGMWGTYAEHLKDIRDVIGTAAGANLLAAMSLLILPERSLFLCDTHINADPTTAELADITLLAAEAVRRFGLVPRAALLSHSSFGGDELPSALKMRDATRLLWRRAPELEVDGEVQGDVALSHVLREQVFPGSRLSGDANLLIMPNLDAANITMSCLRVATGQGVNVGPILLGAARPVHILQTSSTVRSIVNMTALAVVEAGRGG